MGNSSSLGESLEILLANKSIDFLHDSTDSQDPNLAELIELEKLPLVDTEEVDFDDDTSSGYLVYIDRGNPAPLFSAEYLVTPLLGWSN